MTSLLETITFRANLSFGKPMTATNFNQWCEHWIKVGTDWQNQLAAEGLIETAATVGRHVAFTMEHLARRRQVNLKHYRHFPLFADASFVFYEIGYDTISYWMIPGTWRE